MYENTSRRRPRRYAACLTGLVLAATVAASVGDDIVGAASTTEPTAGGEIQWVVYGPMASLDPKMNNPAAHASHGQIYAVYDSLVRTNTDGTIVPRLAESVTPNDDFTHWTIELRPDVQFTDGTPLNAEAVKFNWDRHAQPEQASQCILNAMNIATSTAASETTLEIDLVAPNSQFAYLLDGCMGLIASPTAIEEFGDTYGTTADTVVGAGPFIVESFNSGQDAVLVKNPDFWDAPRPYLDRIEIIGAPGDPQTQAQSLLTGESQLASFGVANLALQTIEDAGYERHTVEQFGGQGWVFNTAKPPLDDVRVRRALILALDRDEVNEQAFAGLGGLPDTFFPEDSPNYDPSLTYPEQDLEEAQRLIDEYLAEQGTDSIDVTMIGLEAAVGQFAVAAQQQFAELNGVNFNIEYMPPLGIRDAVFSGSFDMSAWILSSHSCYPDFFDAMNSQSPRNITGWSDPAVDEAIQRALASDDPEVLAESCREVARAVLDQAPYAVLWRTVVATYAAEELQGVEVFRDGMIDVTTLYLDG